MIAVIGHWQWIDQGMGAGWCSPPGAVSVVDLRAVPDCGLAGTYGVWPWSLFLFEDNAALPGEYHVLGSGRIDEIRPGTKSRDRWAECFGGSPSGETVADWLAWQLTDGATPDGSAPCKPLIPTHRRICEIHVPWHSLLRSWEFGTWNPEGNAYHNRVRDLLRNDLAELATDCQRQRNELGQRIVDTMKGQTDDAKQRQADRLSSLRDSLEFVPGKVLGGLCLKYRGLQAADINADVQPLRPTTTISDDFNRADEPLTNGPWVNVAGTWTVSSNSAYQSVNAHSYAGHTSPLSTADMWSQVWTPVSFAPYSGPSTRVKTTVTQNCYSFYPEGSSGWRFRRYSGTVGTQVALSSTNNLLGTTIRLTSDGSSHYATSNGTLQMSPVTDTTYGTSLGAGLFIYGGLADDFQAADMMVALSDDTFAVQSPFSQGQYVGTVAASGDVPPFRYFLRNQRKR